MSDGLDREDARCPNCGSEGILELHCEHCGYGLKALEEGQGDGPSKRIPFTMMASGVVMAAAGLFALTEGQENAVGLFVTGLVVVVIGLFTLEGVSYNE